MARLVDITPDAGGTLAALLASDDTSVQLRAAQLGLTLGPDSDAFRTGGVMLRITGTVRRLDS